MNAIVACSAWLIGIYVGSLFQAPFEVVALGALLFGGLAIIWWTLPGVRWSGLFALVILLGITRSDTSFQPAANPLSPPSGTSNVRITGTVVSEPERRDRSTLLVVEANHILLDEWEPASGKLLVRVARFPEHKYGDVLDLSGVLKQPRVFEDFDYRGYLARRGIGWVMDFPTVKKVGSDEGIPILRWVYDLRATLTATLNRSLPEPQASLAAGVLLGIRTTIPDDLLEAFSRTATYHILAVSGMNISLLCGLLGIIGRRLLSRRFNLAFLLAGILGYAALVGPQPSVVRASIMGGLLVVAAYLGRPADAVVWLLLSAAAMAAYDPGVLGDVGFQLSFAATAGLALFVPLLQPCFGKLPRWLGEGLAVTLAAQIATVPITALNFGQLSLVTPLANLLVEPAVLPLMIGAALTSALGILFEPAGQLVGWITYFVAGYMVVVVEYLGGEPWASVSLGRFGLLPVVPYYLTLAIVLLGSRKHIPGFGTDWWSLLSRFSAKWVLGGLGVAALVVWAGALTVPSGPTVVSFLDVGQGDAILMQTASGRRVLVDGGPSPSAISNLLGRRLPFWDRSIDLVVLTHANEDHLAGLTEVIERQDVKLVLEPAVPSTSASYLRWLESIRRRNVKAIAARAGQEIPLDEESRLLVLNPQSEFETGDKVDLNENSVVLKLVVGNVSVLLTGDAGKEAQGRMLSSGQDLWATILKVPHHGAAGSLDAGFLDAVRPAVAVISVGASNRFGHPGAETLSRLEGIKVYRTDIDGTVDVGIQGDGYWVRAAGRR
ncbi:MAG: DNA internalization-related competence protein ComEC/Rec2 [Chloroflexi bacterium]|nr:DNA internalization-related competence protein ComEC/Rec2 [Chloroflexota bacterium]